MENKENCKIVKDLLPSYIDELTSKETKKFIENHFNECTDCKETLENMKKNLEKKNKEITNKSVKYAKKYNKKLKKLIAIILILIILICIITFIRNAIILIELKSNYDKQNHDWSNYHMLWSNHSYDQTSVFDIYYKDGKSYQIIHIFSPLREKKDYDTYSKSYIYQDGQQERITIYENENVYRIDIPDSNDTILTSPKNFGHIEEIAGDAKRFIITCFTNIITNEICNGKEAYRIKPIFDKWNAIYIDKETGITIRMKSGVQYQDVHADTYSDVIYEINVVKEDDVKRPNLEGYKIQENPSNTPNDK